MKPGAVEPGSTEMGKVLPLEIMGRPYMLMGSSDYEFLFSFAPNLSYCKLEVDDWGIYRGYDANAHGTVDDRWVKECVDGIWHERTKHDIESTGFLLSALEDVAKYYKSEVSFRVHKTVFSNRKGWVDGFFYEKGFTIWMSINLFQKNVRNPKRLSVSIHRKLVKAMNRQHSSYTEFCKTRSNLMKYLP